MRAVGASGQGKGSGGEHMDVGTWMWARMHSAGETPGCCWGGIAASLLPAVLEWQGGTRARGVRLLAGLGWLRLQEIRYFPSIKDLTTWRLPCKEPH